jgi:Uma2 family endonuclease
MRRSNLAFARDDYISAEDYLAFEREAFEKHEFINGEIVAMAGASENHNVIASNLFGELFVQLKNTKCRAFASDMRVKAVNAKKSNYFYPDIVVTCGERKFEDGKKDVLLNPKVIIEVLSKSTRLKDRNEKLASYFASESLTDYILVEQDAMHIEHYSRIDRENWNIRLLTESSHELVFNSIKCRISLTDVYNEIKFEDVSSKRKKSKT